MLFSCPFNLSRPANRVLWEITGKCNMMCKHCLFYSDNKRQPPDIPLEKILELVNQMQDDGSIDEVWLSGGEPLIRTDIFDIIFAISSVGMIPSVSTNGFLVTPQIAERLKVNGVNYVHLSIDGINPNEHDEFRQKKGALEHVIRAADYLNSVNIITGATCIITWDNILDIEKIVQLALEHNIKVLSFYMIEPLGRGRVLNHSLDRSLMEKICLEYEQLIQRYGGDIHLELFRATKDKEDVLMECKCYNFYTITNDGMLGGCPWLMKSENSTIEVSLNEYNFISARKLVEHRLKDYIKKRNAGFKNCRKCSKASVCGKGCPAVSDLYVGDPLCGYLKNEQNMA